MINKKVKWSGLACCLMLWPYFCNSTSLPANAKTNATAIKHKPIIFLTRKLYAGDLGGVKGANKICQHEAYSKGSIITPGLKFSALIVTAKHYPCDASGQCGGSYASADWPLLPSVIYYYPGGKKFNIVNKNAVFDGQELLLKHQNGKAVKNDRNIWSGAQSILSSSSGNDIVAWASANVNKEKDQDLYAIYSTADCLGFTSNSLVKNGSAGEVGVKSGTAEGSVPPNTWGNFFTFSDGNPGFVFNMWVTGEVLLCSASAALVCVSH